MRWEVLDAQSLRPRHYSSRTRHGNLQAKLICRIRRADPRSAMAEVTVGCALAALDHLRSPKTGRQREGSRDDDPSELGRSVEQVLNTVRAPLGSMSRNHDGVFPGDTAVAIRHGQAIDKSLARHLAPLAHLPRGSATSSYTLIYEKKPRLLYTHHG